MKAFFKTWWINHKVKTLGILAAIFGFMQVSFENIRDLIPQNWRGLALFVFGLLATLFGFMNNNQAPPPPTE